MHNTQISKSLDAIITTATFTATKMGATRNLEDILFLELITHHDSLCYQLLSCRLDEQQLQQIETQLRRITSVAQTSGELNAEDYYHDMLVSISARYPDSRRISTLHALHFIVSDNTTSAYKLLQMNGLLLSTLEEDITQYSIVNSISPLITPQRVSEPPPHPLTKFGVELTALARNGELDPVIGRGNETRRVVEILSRRKKNNPIIVGEAGVGKSAIVEGLALRIVADDVPPTIRGKRLFSLDISALVAGTKFRGEFEERLQQLLTALRESQDAIIFIDEIHTIVGAGSTQGSLDTANILKPALARGEIQTIGATTINEYRESIEADAALDRRFQRVMVQPTSVEQSIEILNTIAPQYELHHSVIYSEEAIEACVELSDRYITERHLPDKAIDLLDEAGARATTTGEKMVIHREDIEQIISDTTGIPAESLSLDEVKRLQNIEQQLSREVIGQQHAIKRLAKTIRRSRAGIGDRSKPIGVFMFVGQTGVGKTHLAKELSRTLFSNDRALIRIDMGEYRERHTVSRLIGSPPGYVGYGEGGELTEAVRRNPYSVVLLDEVEKAHKDIYNILLSIFDEGYITDSAGRRVDFRNTIIIMTSNLGSREVANQTKSVGYATHSKVQSTLNRPRECYDAAISSHFPIELINRIDDIIHFNLLGDKEIEQIIKIELETIFRRTRELGYKLRITDAARRELSTLGSESRYGARALRRVLRERVEEPLSDMIIRGDICNGDEVVIERIRGTRGVRLRCTTLSA